MKSKLILMTLLLSSIINANPIKFKKNRNGTLEIVPVKNLKTEDDKAMVFNNRHLQPLTKKPILRIENFSYEKFLRNKTIGYEFDELAQRDFERAAKKYKGNNFAVILDGEIISAPKVRDFYSSEDLI